MGWYGPRGTCGCCGEPSSSSSSASPCGCDSPLTVKLIQVIDFPYDTITIFGGAFGNKEYAGLSQYNGTYEYVFERFGTNNGVDCKWVADLSFTTTPLGNHTVDGVSNRAEIIAETAMQTSVGVQHKFVRFGLTFPDLGAPFIVPAAASFAHNLCGYPSGDLFGSNPSGPNLGIYRTTYTSTTTLSTNLGTVDVLIETNSVELVVA
jgi:hypothetical protein